MNYLVESIILLCLCLVSPFRAHTHFLSCTHSHTQRDTHNAHILFLKFMKSQKQWSIIINLNLSSQREHIKDTIPSVKHWFLTWVKAFLQAKVQVCTVDTVYVNWSVHYCCSSNCSYSYMYQIFTQRSILVNWPARV